MRKKGRGRVISAGRGSVVVGMGIAGLRRRIVRWMRAVKRSLVYARVEEDLVGLLSLHNPRYRYLRRANQSRQTSRIHAAGATAKRAGLRMSYQVSVCFTKTEQVCSPHQRRTLRSRWSHVDVGSRPVWVFPRMTCRYSLPGSGNGLLSASSDKSIAALEQLAAGGIPSYKRSVALTRHKGCCLFLCSELRQPLIF